MDRLSALVRRLLRRPTPAFADALRAAQGGLDSVVLSVGTLERALAARDVPDPSTSTSFPRAGAK